MMTVIPLFGIVITQIFLLHYSLIAPRRFIITDDEKAPETTDFVNKRTSGLQTRSSWNKDASETPRKKKTNLFKLFSRLHSARSQRGSRRVDFAV